MLTPYKFTILGAIMVALVVGAMVTVLAFIEPNVSPTLVLTALGFITTFVISLFGLLRTEQQTADATKRTKESFREIIEQLATAPEHSEEDNLRDAVLLLLNDATRSEHHPQ